MVDPGQVDLRQNRAPDRGLTTTLTTGLWAMDLATIIGVVLGTGIVIWAISLGGNFGGFIDMPSVYLVFGGTIGAVLMRFSLGGVVTALGTGFKVAFMHKRTAPRDLVETIAELADVNRKQGPLGLEQVAIDDAFLAKGIRFIADGYDGDFIRETMEKERSTYLARLAEGARVYKSMGDAAPAFGMIGTLVGLVQMLGAMDDPSKIGPGMAVALLTTLYGAMIANLIALPIFDKLNATLDEDEVNWQLIIDGVLMIRDTKSPGLVKEMLLSYLPEKHREELAAQGA